MKVRISSRLLADEPMDNNSYIVISITGHEDNYDAGFALTPDQSSKCKGVLKLRFDDITEDIGTYLKAITKEQALLIRAFINCHKDTVDYLLVNCEAGISRSAAIAAAALYLDGQDPNIIFNDPNYIPNTTVYKRVTGIWDYWETT